MLINDNYRNKLKMEVDSDSENQPGASSMMGKVFLYFCIIVFLYFCIFVFLLMYFCTFVLMHICIFAFLHFCIFAFLHFCIFALLHYCIIVLLNYCMIRTRRGLKLRSGMQWHSGPGILL